MARACDEKREHRRALSLSPLLKYDEAVGADDGELLPLPLGNIAELSSFPHILLRNLLIEFN
jgi:hypothetical protein